MKFGKRIIALLVALGIVVGLFGVVAVAAEGNDTTASTYGVYIQCPRCYTASATASPAGSRTTDETVSGCNSLHSSHIHSITRVYTQYNCTSCGSFQTSYVSNNVCRR